MEQKNNGKTENELRVITKAKELALHSYIVTSNSDKFPKKFRHSISDKIQNRCLDIQDKLLEANSINVKNKELRCETITQAITHCNQLSSYIELAMKLHLISGKSAEYWSKLVLDVKRMAIAWRTSQK